MNPSSFKRIAGAVALLTLAGIPAAHAEAFSFGVMGDTQWAGTDPTGNNVNTVAVNQINACNNAFIAAGVKFVVQVGDLCDSNGTNNAALQTRLNANASLNTAGIAFYGLRGNHESSSGSQTFFQSNYIPTASATVAVAKAPDNTSYSVTYNNTKLVLLDINTSTNTTTLATDTTWMNTQLGAADHTQAFVFSHKNLLGQNHKDNEFGGDNDANPALQNAFIGSLDANNVKYAISGHDHIDHRSIVTSPDGLSSVQQVICASDSYKYYTPSAPYSTRETPIAQEMNKTGYTIYTVDGPRVTAKYYSTTPLANGDVPANATFTLKDTFGYSLNGTEKLVAQGGAYAMTHSIAAGTSYGESGYVGTAMAILAGTNGSTAKTYDGRATTKDVNIGWAPETKGPAGALSDVLSITGMTDLGKGDLTDTFALSLTFAASGLSVADLNSLFIASKDANGNWLNTVDLNFGGTKNFVTGLWNNTYGLGTYGVDAATSTLWAVVNHNSDFVAIPEPSTYAAIFGAAVLGLAGVRRFRRQVA